MFKRATNLWGPLMTTLDHSLTEAVLQARPDIVIADMEHSLIGVEHLQNICMVSGTTPVIARMKGLEKNEIKRVLDTGVSGIIVPGIESKEDAQNVARFSRFAPEGRRGAGPGRASGYGSRFSDYLQSRPVIMVQIETRGAFEAVQEIAEVKGLDGLFVGPFDLSIALETEYSWDNRNFVDAVRKIKDTAASMGLITGIYSPLSPDLMKRTAEEKFNFLMLGMDREAMVITYSNAGKTLKTLGK